MKYLLIIFVFLPTLSFAMSPENVYFFGRNDNGKEVLIEFYSGGFSWNGNNLTYSDRKNNNFQYCWITSEKDPDNYWKSSFQCTSSESTSPTIVFKAVPEYESVLRGKYSEYTSEYKNALGVFLQNKKWVEIYGEPLGIYKCDTGCTKDVPRLLFESTHVNGD